MLYNIYENIGEDDLIAESKILAKIEKKIRNMFIDLGWQETIPEEPYTLAIDFTNYNQNGGGNIGLSYEDLPGKKCI